MNNNHIKFTYDTEIGHEDNFERWYYIESHNRGLSGKKHIHHEEAKSNFEEIYGKLILESNKC
tara:strand:- start:135 stop:323 length:189 start_codon:yes stop_codon:yes gene_type:complete